MNYALDAANQLVCRAVNSQVHHAVMSYRYIFKALIQHMRALPGNKFQLDEDGCDLQFPIEVRRGAGLLARLRGQRYRICRGIMRVSLREFTWQLYGSDNISGGQSIRLRDPHLDLVNVLRYLTMHLYYAHRSAIQLYTRDAEVDEKTHSDAVEREIKNMDDGLPLPLLHSDEFIRLKYRCDINARRTSILYIRLPEDNVVRKMVFLLLMAQCMHNQTERLQARYWNA